MQFSEHETSILKILGRRKMSIHELTEKFYNLDDVEVGPIECNYIAVVVRRIKVKCEKLKTPWTLTGKGAGRAGRVIWRGKRTKTKKPKRGKAA